ncbi:Gfo/Idh/MocA family oxidoreductase [Metabacillus sp. cB07]|uniref:Gfo/Idh/MocA family oxidoreductase n=1 Tax=Metabacillus sp. cB07 TaxID=2806989 RepID=UPI001939CB47|nr:Gfo/Idh/MocA family oxidoreductase [Metabacillus sp. cB07]
MSNHISHILLIGCGEMGVEYAKVLKEMKQPFYPYTRSDKTAARFKEQTGYAASSGEFAAFLANHSQQKAIVAVPVHQLKSTAMLLLKSGVKELLLEKPGASSLKELNEIAFAAANFHARVYIGYNRRFYESVQKLQSMVTEENPIRSIHFDFTEMSKKIEGSAISGELKTIWLLANSSHVIDLAFFLAGRPKSIKGFVSGHLAWHPDGAIFTGAGETDQNILFSYHANWMAPGRWGIEVRTVDSTYILQPLEKLYSMKHGSFLKKEVPIAYQYDETLKPGLYRQVESFLTDKSNLVSLEEQCRNVKEIYLYLLNKK